MIKMKKILFTMLCLLTLSSAQAQTKAEQLKEIRQLYAKAKDKVAQNGKKAPNKHFQLVLNNKNEDSPFPWKEIVDIYFDEVLEVSGDMPLRGEGAYFMTRKFTHGDIDIYQEWLFDMEDLGKPVFAYQCQQQNDGTKLESRYYWNNYELIEVKSNDRDSDPEGAFMLRYAQEYIQVFNTIANRNWE